MTDHEGFCCNWVKGCVGGVFICNLYSADIGSLFDFSLTMHKQGENAIGSTHLSVSYCLSVYTTLTPEQFDLQSGNLFDQAARPWRLYKRLLALI